MSIFMTRSLKETSFNRKRNRDWRVMFTWYLCCNSQGFVSAFVTVHLQLDNYFLLYLLHVLLCKSSRENHQEKRKERDRKEKLKPLVHTFMFAKLNEKATSRSCNRKQNQMGVLVFVLCFGTERYNGLYNKDNNNMRKSL